MLQVTDENNNLISEPCTIKQFIDDNSDDDEVIELVNALEIGQSVNVGGGAGPMFTIIRIS